MTFFRQLETSINIERKHRKRFENGQLNTYPPVAYHYRWVLYARDLWIQPRVLYAMLPGMQAVGHSPGQSYLLRRMHGSCCSHGSITDIFHAEPSGRKLKNSESCNVNKKNFPFFTADVRTISIMVLL